MSSNVDSTVRNRLVIVILLEAVLYCVLWLWDEYVASYITLVFPVMILGLLTGSGYQVS